MLQDLARLLISVATLAVASPLVVYAAYVDINARIQTQALLLSSDIVTMDEPELFTPEEFDINRPWKHLKQKTLDDEAKARVDRAQFGLDQTQFVPVKP